MDNDFLEALKEATGIKLAQGMANVVKEETKENLDFLKWMFK